MTTAKKQKTSKTKVRTVDPNQNPYRQMKHRPKYKKTPRSLYFYYIGEEVAGSRAIRRYYYPSVDGKIKQKHLPGLIKDLGMNARADGKDPPPDGVGWKNIVWTRKSYLVFLLDDLNTDFAPGEAIYFETGNNNYTLFDAKDLTVDLSPQGNGGRVVTAVYCTNHMKRNKGGNDLDYEAQEVKFKLRTDPMLLYPTVPDDGGTNMGPPVPPPA